MADPVGPPAPTLHGHGPMATAPAKTAAAMAAWPPLAPAIIAARRSGMAAGRGDGRPAAARTRGHRSPAPWQGIFDGVFRQTFWQTL